MLLHGRPFRFDYRKYYRVAKRSIHGYVVSKHAILLRAEFGDGGPAALIHPVKLLPQNMGPLYNMGSGEQWVGRGSDQFISREGVSPRRFRFVH